MNCLITGGAGHIGSHLALRLHEEGHQVDIIDNISVGKRDAIKDLTDNGWNGKYVKTDIKDSRMVAYALQQRNYDICFHLAGYAIPDDSVKNPIVYYENNLSPFPQFISSLIFHGVGRIVTCIPSEYEKYPYQMCSNGIQRMVEDVSVATPQLKYSSFVLPEVVGNSVDGKIGDYGFDNKNKLIPNCMSAAAKLKPNVRVKNGADICHLIHVDDAVENIMKALKDTENCKYEVGCGVTATKREIVESCIKVTAGRYPFIEDEYIEDPEFAGTCQTNSVGIKEASITCLDTITKSTWNWIKIVKNLP